jgi:hypothetical protein
MQEITEISDVLLQTARILFEETFGRLGALCFYREHRSYFVLYLHKAAVVYVEL